MKIVLIVPNTRWFNKRPWIFVPYSVLIITKLLKDKFDFSVIDANAENFSLEKSEQLLKKCNPDITLVTSASVEYHKQAHAAIKIAKSACPKTTTILGGIYATTLYEEAIKDTNIDWIFLNHAEERLINFLQKIENKDIEGIKNTLGIAYRQEEGKLVVNPIDKYIGDVKKMVKPDYSLLNVEAYLKHNTLDYQYNSDKKHTTIISSYGCPYNCIFCATRTISGRKIVFRSVDDVLEEMEFLMEKYNVGCFSFEDDCFLADKNRIHKILNAFLDRKYNIEWKISTVSAWHLDNELLELMKKAGCTQITISIESGNQQVLSKLIKKPLKLEIIPSIVKKCRELDLDLAANFVIGIPGETWDEIRETCQYADNCGIDLVHFHIATPLPKTDLYNIAKEKGYLPKNFSFINDKHFGFCEGSITTEEFTPFELQVIRAFEWDRINFKNREKIDKIASRYYLTSIDNLNKHRQETRKKLGIHF